VADELKDEGLPSSEDLDAIAQEQSIADATANAVNTSVCTTCGEPATNICIRCGQDYCDRHRCIMHAEPLPSQREDVITDEDGTEHRGLRIRLIGEGWPNALRMIKDMSDEELENQINGLQKLLQDAIKTADYARISISAREYELDYRKHSRYVAAVKRREKLQQGTIKLNAKRHKLSGESGIPADLLTLMKAFNITQKQAEQLKLALGGTAKK
jgi:hypothetical protein